MRKILFYTVFVLCALVIGFLIGAYQAGIFGPNVVAADADDYMPDSGAGMYNGTYYYGRGMGMGMGMMGPIYGYGMYNDSYYCGGMGMGMGMMGPMYGNYMAGSGYYGGCPVMGGYYDDYWNNSNPNPTMNMTASNINSQVMVLADTADSATNTPQTATTASPLIIAGLGIAFLGSLPISWKILQQVKN
jgi:hypothetical protein